MSLPRVAVIGVGGVGGILAAALETAGASEVTRTCPHGQTNLLNECYGDADPPMRLNRWMAARVTTGAAHTYTHLLGTN